MFNKEANGKSESLPVLGKYKCRPIKKRVVLSKEIVSEVLIYKEI